MVHAGLVVSMFASRVVGLTPALCVEFTWSLILRIPLDPLVSSPRPKTCVNGYVIVLCNGLAARPRCPPLCAPGPLI